MKRIINKILRFPYWLWFEFLKISYKETQFYYGNKIQEKSIDTKNVGAGSILVFSNKKEELLKLEKELGLYNKTRIAFRGYPTIQVYGSKIGLVKQKSTIKTSLPTREIIRILRNQKTDKL